MAEEWRKTTVNELYEVSNIGRVRSLPRMVKREQGSYVTKGKILKQRLDHKGYWTVQFDVNGKHKEWKVHRLVAQAFIDNPCNKPEVGHLDNNPKNNNVENLEWCTHKENMDWMHKTGRADRTPEWLENLHKSQEPTYKAVIGTHLNTGEEIYFRNMNSVREAGFQPSCVCNCCKGNRGVKQHLGYSWRYA